LAYLMFLLNRERANAWFEGRPGWLNTRAEEKEWVALALWKVQVPTKVWVFLWLLARHSLPSGDARTNLAQKLLCQPMYPPEPYKICAISRYCNLFELIMEVMYCGLAVIYMYAIVMAHKLNEPSRGNFSMVLLLFMWVFLWSLWLWKLFQSRFSFERDQLSYVFHHSKKLPFTTFLHKICSHGPSYQETSMWLEQTVWSVLILHLSLL
jgi:hypothetical protein